MEIADYKVREAKKINIKSKLHYCNTEKVYNGLYETVLTTVKSSLNNDITKKKRK